MTTLKPQQVLRFKGEVYEVLEIKNEWALLRGFDGCIYENWQREEFQEALFPVDTIPRKPNCRPTIEEIIQYVVDYYHIDQELLLAKKRPRHIVTARHMVYYLSVAIVGHRLVSVGNAMRTDHTTVIHGREKIRDLLFSCDDIVRDVEALKNQIFGLNKPKCGHETIFATQTPSNAVKRD